MEKSFQQTLLGAFLVLSFMMLSQTAFAESPSQTPANAPVVNAPAEVQPTFSLQDELLKSFMASMTYTPESLALPADSEIPDEPWAQDLGGAPMDSIQEADKKDLEPKQQAQKLKKPLTTASILNFLKPVQNMLISSGFGFRWGRQHEGVDIAANSGTSIYAAEAGKVIFSGWNGGYGNLVTIDHGGGFTTRYGHASKLLVRNGQTVKKGQVIAKVGSTGHSTGPHLHFEVLAKGVPQNPLRFLNRNIGIAASKQAAVQ